MFLSKAKTDPDSSCSLAGDPDSSKPTEAPMDSSAQNDTFPSQLQGSFVPTVTAISSTPDLQWMVQPTIIASVSPSLGTAEASEPAKSKAAGNKGKCAARKSKSEQICGVIPLDLTMTTATLFLKRLDCLVSRVSPVALHSEAASTPRGRPQDMEIPLVPTSFSTDLGGNGPPPFPDIDLTGSLGITDWETLYKSVVNDLEPLSTTGGEHIHTHLQQLPVRIYLRLPELEVPGRGLEGCKGGMEQSRKLVSTSSTLSTLLAYKCQRSLM
ncbi:hypothetical protein cypCar_00040993 [Cyprinus carpio]|nr:hypothetical protein cypCar_00040993 [Cyprinus carpio]